MLKQKTMHEYDFPPYLSKSYMALSFATISVTKKQKKKSFATISMIAIW